mmetsp:Transcript_8731/g.26131  ORF Transcript_8731/g.26131 Transcript_8731/m.26131 type:complete len:231 (+) Transcript_8731:904-1596(+)
MWRHTAPLSGLRPGGYKSPPRSPPPRREEGLSPAGHRMGTPRERMCSAVSAFRFTRQFGQRLGLRSERSGFSGISFQFQVEGATAYSPPLANKRIRTKPYHSVQAPFDDGNFEPVGGSPIETSAASSCRGLRAPRSADKRAESLSLPSDRSSFLTTPAIGHSCSERKTTSAPSAPWERSQRDASCREGMVPFKLNVPTNREAGSGDIAYPSFSCQLSNVKSLRGLGNLVP